MPRFSSPARPKNPNEYPAAYTQEIRSLESDVPLERRISDQEDFTEGLFSRTPNRKERLLLDQWDIGAETNGNTRHEALDIAVGTLIDGYEPNGFYLDSALFQIGGLTRNSTHIFAAVIERYTNVPASDPAQRLSRVVAVLAFDATTRAFDRTRSWTFVPVKDGYRLYEFGSTEDSHGANDDHGNRVTIFANEEHLWIAADDGSNYTRNFHAYSLDPTLIWDGYSGNAREPNRALAHDIGFLNPYTPAAEGVDGAQIVDARVWMLHQDRLYIAGPGVQNIRVLDDDDTPYEYHFYTLSHRINDTAVRYIDFWYHEREDILYMLAIDANADPNAGREYIVTFVDFLERHAEARRSGEPIAQPPVADVTQLDSPYAKGVVGDPDASGGVLWLSRGSAAAQALEAYTPTRGTVVLNERGASPRNTLNIITHEDLLDLRRSLPFLVRVGNLPYKTSTPDDQFPHANNGVDQSGQVFMRDVTNTVLATGLFGSSGSDLATGRFMVETYYIRLEAQPSNLYFPNGPHLRRYDMFRVEMWENNIGLATLFQDNRLYVPVRASYPLRLYGRSTAAPGELVYEMNEMFGTYNGARQGVAGLNVEDWKIWATMRRLT